MPRLLRIGPRLAVLALALGLVVLELGLYHLGPWGHVAAVDTDARLGWRKLPGQRVRAVTGELEAINSYGYRDRDWYAPGTLDEDELLRVAVLGDSVSYGFHVEVERTWGRELERRLRAAAPEREAIVMSFAMPGYVLEQMARVWEDDARAFRPDVVLVALNAYSARPMRRIEPPRDFPLRRLFLRTAIFDWIQRGLVGDRSFLITRPEGALDRETLHDVHTRIATDQAMRADPFAPEFEQEWRAAAARLHGLREELEARGGRLALVSLPRLPDVLGEGPWVGERWARWCELWPGAVHVDPLPAFRAAMAGLLEEIAAAGRAPEAYFTRRPERRPAGELERRAESLYHFADPEHLTPRGHALLGEVVYEALAQAGALDAR